MSKIITADALGIVTIWQEAQGEPYEGKCAVGEVIRDRTLKNYFSHGSIASTVLWPYQFSGWNHNNGSDLRERSCVIDDTDPVVIDCIRAWNQSKTSRYAKGALLYCNMNLAHPSWAKPEKLIVEIGQHSFFAV